MHGPANTVHWPCVGMLAYRLRRWPNIAGVGYVLTL